MTVSKRIIPSEQKFHPTVHMWDAFMHNECSSAVIFDRNIDELTTAMGNFWKKKNAKITVPIKDEFQHYLNVSELPALEEYDPFVWWLTNKNQYPMLHKLAMKYLSIQFHQNGFFLMLKINHSSKNLFRFICY
ncbi:unnamed protein product [Rhizophagus irregularis]|nr:unnamed protein product [Rhizophagus irregularis]